MADLVDSSEKAAALLAASVSAGMTNIGQAFEALYCAVAGETEKESTLLSLMATRARLMALEIVLMKSGVPALGSDAQSLSELILAVRRGVMIAHVVSKALSMYEAEKLFPELKISEVLDSDWEKSASGPGLAKALKTLSRISKADFRPNRQ